MTQRAEVEAGVGDAALDGQTAFVTGATSGVGREVALALGRLGARVVIHGRDETRGRAVADDLDAIGADPAFLTGDFADPDAPEQLAAAVADRVDSLDILVHAAGAHFRNASFADYDGGVERTFAVNQLAPFALTETLRAQLSLDRVVIVSSEVHRRADGGDLTRDAVTTLDGYEGFHAYSRSKLANAVWARALAERTDLSVASCHPGFVPGSGLWRTTSLPLSLLMRVFDALPQRLVGRLVDTAPEAAATPTYLAVADDIERGAYYRDCAPGDPSDAVTDDALADHVWNVSADLTE